MLRAAGLDVREVNGVDGEPRELVVTNPCFTTLGRVVIDRDGLMEWDYWGHVRDEDGAADIASVIVGVLCSRPGEDGERPGRLRILPPPDERDRPHPLRPCPTIGRRALDVRDRCRLHGPRVPAARLLPLPALG